MDLSSPTEADIRDLADAFGLLLTDDDVSFFRERVADALVIYDVATAYDTDGTGPARVDPSTRSGTEPRDDPLNCWITRCDIQTSDTGPLAGWTLGIKDGISVAGLQRTSGSRVFEGVVPNYDAPVVTRILDAGGRIVGKTNMDDMGNSGDGSSSAFGAVRNPADPAHLSGGSSGGSAAAVADGQVDAALGTDSGGSIRAPAAWCGAVGHKPTHGLVPYTGISGLERTTDHVGPIAPDVETAATLLSVIAGRDPSDARQPRHLPTHRYEAELDPAPDTLSVGVVTEGFDQPGADGDLNAVVRAALDGLADAGATVDEVSIPIHADGQAIQGASVVLGMLESYRTDGAGRNHKGWYDEAAMRSFHDRMRDRAGDIPASVVHSLLLGAHVDATADDPALYGHLMNARRRLEAAYDDELADYDVLALPTTPMPAYEHRPDATRGEWLDRSLTNLSNTAPFNVTGHPAASVPVGTTGGLPVGLELVGTHFADHTVLNAAATVEATHGAVER
jgi:amidase